jgi:hypothetical protein
VVALLATAASVIFSAWLKRGDASRARRNARATEVGDEALHASGLHGGSSGSGC